MKQPLNIDYRNLKHSNVDETETVLQRIDNKRNQFDTHYFGNPALLKQTDLELRANPDFFQKSQTFNKSKIFIVPDKSSFWKLSNKLKFDEQVIYRSIVHYWSITPLSNEQKYLETIKVLDLDSIVPVITTLEFDETQEFIYQIPIIAATEPAQFNFTEFDVKLFTRLAQAATKKLKLEPEDAFKQLADHIRVLPLPKTSGTSIDWVFPFTHMGKTKYRKCTLSNHDIKVALRKTFEETNLAEFLKKLDFSKTDLIISKWAPWLAKKHNIIPEKDSDFFTIYEKLIASNTPLYYGMLDTVDFKIKVQVEKRKYDELKINVCTKEKVREGETKRFIGQAEIRSKTGEIAYNKRFTAPKNAYFPVYVNDEQDINADGHSKVLQIHNEVPCDISIHFALSMGKQVNVMIQNYDTQEVINSSFEYIDLSEESDAMSHTFSLEDDYDARIKRLESSLDNYQLIIDDLSNFSLELQEYYLSIKDVEITLKNFKVFSKSLLDKLDGFYCLQKLNPQTNKRPAADDLFLGSTLLSNTDFDHQIPDIKKTIHSFKVINNLVSIYNNYLSLKEVIDFLNSKQRNDIPSNQQPHRVFNRFIVSIGRFYGFTDYFDLNRSKLLELYAKIRKLNDQSLKKECTYLLGRVAVDYETQKAIINETNFFVKNALKSQTEQSLSSLEPVFWALSRMLVWHCHYKELSESVDIKDFIINLTKVSSLIKKLKNLKDQRRPYTQPLCVAFIYLLFFREFDETLGQKGSTEHKLLNEFIAVFTDDRIRLKSVSNDDLLTDILSWVLNNEFDDSRRKVMVRLSSNIN